MFLDCCCSALSDSNIGFSEGEPESLIRTLEWTGYDVPSIPDSMWSDFPDFPTLNDTPQSRNISQFAFPGLAAYVLLIACAPSERAYEIHRRGVFSSAILGVLEQPSLARPSYEGLIDQVGRLCSRWYALALWFVSLLLTQMRLT